MKAGLAAELIERVKAGLAQFFERLVVELLLELSYGGSRKDANQAVKAGVPWERWDWVLSVCERGVM
jgi:restriction endonuclease Mrr